MLKMIRNFIYKRAIKFPIICRYSRFFYKKLGVSLKDGARLSAGVVIYGDYKNLILHRNSEINYGCFLLAKNKILVGENSTLAYKVTILTSANPNGPLNLLSRIYPKMTAPVIIGDNVWIGANSVILPGITVGRCSVVAAGAVVTKDVKPFTLVAGVPAKMIKEFDSKIFNDSK